MQSFMNRRLILLFGLTAAMAAGPVALAQGVSLNMSPADAHKLVTEKKAVLVDIRTPSEWAETGVAEGAQRIDMTDPLFMAKLSGAVGGDRTKPIALICRTASRTRVVQQALMQMGYTQVINIEGGMVGNSADQGWIRRGLPVKKD